MSLPDDPIVNRNDAEVGWVSPPGWGCDGLTENENLVEIPVTGNFGETLKEATVRGNSTWDWTGHKLSAADTPDIEVGDIWDFTAPPYNYKKFKVLRVSDPQPAADTWKYNVRLEETTETAP